jgi:hypothetical protein
MSIMDDQPVARDKFQEALDNVRIAMLEAVADEREKTRQVVTAIQDRFEKRLRESFAACQERLEKGLRESFPNPPDERSRN